MLANSSSDSQIWSRDGPDLGIANTLFFACWVYCWNCKLFLKLACGSTPFLDPSNYPPPPLVYYCLIYCTSNRSKRKESSVTKLPSTAALFFNKSTGASGLFSNGRSSKLERDRTHVERTFFTQNGTFYHPQNLWHEVFEHPVGLVYIDFQISILVTGSITGWLRVRCTWSRQETYLLVRSAFCLWSADTH
jgi:hypothetical protein